MIIHFGDIVAIGSLRNGFGVDLESTESKPVHLRGQLEDGEIVEALGYFNGLVLLLPFTMLMVGRCYVFDES